MATPVSRSSLSLDQWPAHVWAEIEGFAPAREDEESAVLLRLAEIGFLPGERVRVTARGFPGGNPLAVRVGQTTFALRRHEAALIRVRAVQVEGAAA